MCFHGCICSLDPRSHAPISHRREGRNFLLRSQNWAPVSARKLSFRQVCPGGRILVIPPSFPKRKLTPFSKETLWIYFLEKNLKLLFSQWWVSFQDCFLSLCLWLPLLGPWLRRFWAHGRYIPTCVFCVYVYISTVHIEIVSTHWRL